jgi:fructan beta-fructosidase
MTSLNTVPALECRYRPKWHYAAERNWLNDPNGLLYSNGLYHLFYQHNPQGDVWGNMSWGHATSTDLLTWDEQPVAIPCDGQEAIFSGSAVVDTHNTSGFGDGGSAPLVAIYTSAYSPASPLAGRQAQSLAYSTDDGATWVKYDGNPVLDRASANFRDPKVFWYEGEAGSYWVMAVVEAEDREVLLYKSADLRTWEYLSSFGPANATGGVWECPDLFELPVEGVAGDARWVLVVNLNPGGIAGGSAGQYFVGTFDGVTFRSESTVTEGLQADDSRMQDYGWLDWGRDYYAAVSFSNAPGGRRLMIGWMNNWQYAAATPSQGWRSAMSLVREVRLKRHAGRLVLVQTPVDPFASYGTELFTAGPTWLARRAQLADPAQATEGVQWLPAVASAEVFRIDAEFRPGTAGTVGLVLRAGEADGVQERTVLAYSAASGELSLDRTISGDVGFHEDFPSVERAPVQLQDGLLRLTVFLDRCSVEVFAQDGLVTLTDQIFPAESSTAIGLLTEGEGGTLLSLSVTG